MSLTDKNVHTVPTEGREHAVTGYDCWCGPRVLQLCEGCVERATPDDRCWQCGGEGTVPCPDPALYDGPHGLIVVHNEAA